MFEKYAYTYFLWNIWYNINIIFTFSVYEIQRKYVEHDFVVSRPFVYFVIDTHTKVSLIAGVITDPLAAPIWN